MSRMEAPNSPAPVPNTPTYDLSDPAVASALAARARELLSLAEVDRARAERAFEKLGFEAQLATSKALTGDDLQEWLLLSEDCSELVRSLPPEHLHHAIRLIGAEDALAILNAASSEQLQAIFDIEWYTDGDLDPKKVRKWLELLMELNETEADRCLANLDVYGLAMYLKKYVKLPPGDEGQTMVLALHTNQGWMIDNEQLMIRDDLVRNFMRFVQQLDNALFIEILYVLFCEDERSADMAAFGLREDRLLRRGFPVLAQAEALLVPVDLRPYDLAWARPEKPPAATPSTEGTPPEQAAPPATPEPAPLEKAHDSSVPFLLHALAWGRRREMLGEKTEYATIKEAADLANSLLIAHAKDPGEPGVKTEALASVQVLASLALECVSRGNVNVAVEQLKRMDLTELFRVGWTLARQVTSDAWALTHKPKFQNVAEPLRVLVNEASDLMSWRQIARTADPNGVNASGAKVELLTWRRLSRLKSAVDDVKKVV